MFQRDLKVFGGGKTGSKETTTPDNIEPIGKPQIHILSGATGVGKSNVARNLMEAYDSAHRKVKTKPAPEYLIFTGAGGDPVWEGANSERVKLFTPKEENDFVDAVNLRYDRAMRAKDRGAGPLATPAPADPAAPDHRPAMVIIDDAAASGLIPQQMARSPIAQALQSHRHADMSFVVSSQRYHGHNPWLRANAGSVNVFPPKGSEELNFLKRDLPLPHAALNRGFAVATAKGIHNFLHVDMKNRVATHNFSGETI